MCVHMDHEVALPGSLLRSPTPWVQAENISQGRANLVKATAHPKRISMVWVWGVFSKHRHVMEKRRKFQDPVWEFQEITFFLPRGGVSEEGWPRMEHPSPQTSSFANEAFKPHQRPQICADCRGGGNVSFSDMRKWAFDQVHKSRTISVQEPFCVTSPTHTPHPSPNSLAASSLLMRKSEPRSPLFLSPDCTALGSRVSWG